MKKTTFKDAQNAFKIPKNIKQIVPCCFTRNFVQTVIFHQDVKIIDTGDFHQCVKLNKIEFPQNSKLRTIGYLAFDLNNSEFRSISIPSSVTKIYSNAFSQCKGLTKVEILPDSKLQSVGNFT